ncbi:hypothetical protein B0J12DRAFT_361665 [Macrophomina phaseolina]|uniref:Uncharacterized protein n=1 Tax=Macrophomina phaseolina TaxID=35725 RepID=A0ABQ8FUS5_9PEZI|nr:hypothetical protein B0J12DRAFT_361665 [Macrophomina phaseolina]
MAVNDISIAGAPALIEWQQVDGTTSCLGDGVTVSPHRPSVDLVFDASQHQAFFKLWIRVSCKNFVKRVNVYLLIHPERVLSVHAVRDQEQIPTSIRNAFAKHGPVSHPMTALQFVLRVPGSLVGPASEPLLPSTNASRSILQSLYALARATKFTVYLAEEMPSEPLETFTLQVRDGGLKSIEFHANINTLYGGKGGEVIEPQDEVAACDSPPSYDEIALTPPPQPPQLKRSRATRDISCGCGTIMSAEEAHRIRTFSFAVQSMQQELRTLLEAGKPCSRCGSLAGRLEQVEQMVETLQSHLPDLSDDEDAYLVSSTELDGRLDGLKSDAEDMMDVKIEDNILDIKSEVRNFVSEELKDVEDRIKDELRTAVLTIDF